MGPNVSGDPGGALGALLKALELESARPKTQAPLRTRRFSPFSPGGEGLSTEELQGRLSEAVMHRIRIVGGVSSANDPERTIPGLQFAGHDVYRGALVAARIAGGCPLGTSLGMGIDATQRFVHVKRFSPDQKTIEEFQDGPPEQALKEETGLVLLGRRTRDYDLVMALRRP